MKLALAFVSFVSLVFLAPLPARAEPPAPADSRVFELEPFKIKGTAASNFAIDSRILVDAETKKVRPDITPNPVDIFLGLHSLTASPSISKRSAFFFQPQPQTV